MDDDRDDDLLDEEPGLFEQAGPDLFGLGDPDELDVLEPPLDEADALEEPGAPDAPERRHTDDHEITESLVAVVEALREPPAEALTRPEAPLALYRRYRPDTFADVIGQEHVTEPLQRALVNNRVNHAYLFSGPRGCGKTTSARILARALNCVQGPAPVPCGECQSCRDLARGGPGSLDVIEIDAASHGGVDDARDLRERAFFAPVHSRYKIYIVDEAHMVTTAGFNALLKVVEEPPPHVKFIFATTEPDKVIGTIRSRTHHYPFRLVPPKTLSGYLGQLCVSEGVTVEPSVLPLVVRAGAGSVRDSLSVLDQLLGGAGEAGVTYAQATALLGYTPDTLLDEIVDAFAAGDANGVFACVDKVIEVGQDPRRFAEDLLRRLRDLIIVAAVPDALTSGLVEVAGDQAERLTSQANALGSGELTRAAEVIAQGLTEMRGTTAPRLHLELMCARVLLPGADVDGRGLHARLDRLERRIGVESAGGPAAEPRAVPERPVGRPGAAPPRAPEATPRADTAPARAPDGAPAKAANATPASAPERSRGADPAAAAAQDVPASAVPTEAPGADGEDARLAAFDPEPPPGSPSPSRPAETVLADADGASTATAADGDAPAQVGPAADTPVKAGPTTDTPVKAGPTTGTPAQVGPAADAPAEVGPAADAPAKVEHAAEATPAGASPVGSFGTADLRRLWPQVLAEVKTRRRFTWIILSQNAQVLGVADGVLTLGISNAGARDSFGRGGSDEVLREAILQVAGAALRIEAILDPSAEPAPASASPVAPRATAPRPAAAEEARANIRPTQSAPSPADEPDEPPVSRDDENVDEGAGDHSELLAKHLGAELIADEQG